MKKEVKAKKKPMLKKKVIMVSRLEVKAVIPTRQYENIQPLIELKDVELKAGTDIAMNHIKGMVTEYSEHGAFKNKEVATAPTVKINVTVKMKSFNESGVEVDFDPINHKYFYKGKELAGGSTVAKRFYKPFDMEKISKVCSNAWDIPAEEIVSIWDSNGDITGQFGTLIHKVLEHSILHKENGKKISEKKKDKVDPSEMKHPLLKGIVDGFNKMYEATKIKGDILTEVFVTDVKNGVCGQIDRLVVIGKKKVVRIQDYKVNIGAETKSSSDKPLKPFEDLPSNKITKYQIQMSVYANMLQNSGFEVEGLDAFVLEDSWEHFELSVLKVIK